MPTFSRKTSEYRQSKPGGLYLPMHASLKGRVRWQVLDERGVPEIPRSQSGFALGPIEGVEQDNLITDYGLDGIAEYPVQTTLTGGGWRSFLAVGTGSSEPAFTDTALDNEVQRAATAGAFSPGVNVGELDTVNNVWRAACSVTRLAVMSTDRNLTEFGLSSTSSSGMNIRELLRDSGGDPVAVSLLEGKSLRLDHTLIIGIPAPENGQVVTIGIDEYDAGNNFIGSTPMEVAFGMWTSSLTSANIVSPNPSTNASALQSVIGMWEPAVTAQSGIRSLVSSSYPYGRTADILNTHVSPVFGTNAMTGLSSTSYIPGLYERSKRATVAAGTGNWEWYGVIFSGYATGHARKGAFLRFVDPPSYTKQSTDTLQFGIRSTWGRA